MRMKYLGWKEYIHERKGRLMNCPCSSVGRAYD
jgi:hypothetical protein